MKMKRMFFLFAIIFLLGFALFYRTGYATDRQKRTEQIRVCNDSKEATKDQQKLYKTIEICPGDSLWAIAEEYRDEHYDSLEDYIQDLKEINHLETDCIEEGNYLTVAYYL